MHRRRAGWPIRELATIERGSLLRTAAFLTFAAASIATLILALPVARYYRTADYELAHFDYEIVGVLGDTELRELEAIATPNSLIAFNSLSPATLQAGGRSTGVVLYFTATPDRIGESWFSDQAVIASAAIQGNWLDITADAAHTLGVQPGDTVSTPLGGGTYQARIRRILALDSDGFAAAMGPLTAQAAALLPVDPDLKALFPTSTMLATVTLLRSNLSAEQVLQSIKSAPKSDSFVVERRLDVLQALDDQDPLTTLPTVAAVTLLGLLCLLGLAIREGGTLVRRRRVDLAVLAALGATRLQIIRSMMVLELGSLAIAAIVAALLVEHLAYGVLLAPVLPPIFELPLWLGLIVGTASYLVTLAAATAYHLRRSNLVAILASGAAK